MKYDYKEGSKSILVVAGTKARVIMLSIQTLLDMGSGGFLKGVALNDYKMLKEKMEKETRCGE